MEPVVIALASNERYFPGLYCVVASALSQLDVARGVELKVLDGGISATSRRRLSKLIEKSNKQVGLEFVTVEPLIFRNATLGPGQSHMTYCRILLPQLLGVRRLIYLDCDVLVFRDLSELFGVSLSPGKVIAAVADCETLSLADDSLVVANAMQLPTDAVYFNCGVMLMNLDELRRQNFTKGSLEFFEKWKQEYRFWDQSAFNFLLHGQIHELPEQWNRASWRFDVQRTNELNCVLHYTTSAPWLGGTHGPAQVLFERFAADAGVPLNRHSSDFKRSIRRNFWRNALAPLRAVAFPIACLLYKIAGNREKSAAYAKVACYWFDYVRNSPRRRRLHQRRAQEIQAMRFKLVGSESAT